MQQTATIEDIPAPRVPGVEILARQGADRRHACWRARKRPGESLLLLLANKPSIRPEKTLRLLAGWSQARHPALASCLEAGLTVDGRPWLLVDDGSGEPLADLLTRGPLPAAEAVAIIRDLARGLAALHAEGLLHREVWVGAVRMEADSARPGGRRPCLVPPSPSAPGDPRRVPAELAACLAPEAFDDLEGCDQRADLYGLGTLLIHCLTGRPAYAPAPAERQAARKSRMLRPWSTRGFGDVRVGQLIAGLIHPDPAQRPDSATSVAARCDELLAAGLHRPGPGLVAWMAVAALIAVTLITWCMR